MRKNRIQIFFENLEVNKIRKFRFQKIQKILNSEIQKIQNLKYIFIIFSGLSPKPWSMIHGAFRLRPTSVRGVFPLSVDLSLSLKWRYVVQKFQAWHLTSVGSHSCTHPAKKRAVFLLKKWYWSVQNSFRTSRPMPLTFTAGKTHLVLVHNCGKAFRTTLLPRKAVAAATVVYTGMSDQTCRNIVTLE